MKNLSKTQIKKAIAEVKSNLENLFASGFYSELEYQKYLEDISYFEIKEC